ncbi:hypothetical protein [Chitinimonas sp.]|uniref:hypothetical protein n=1 Tax=Chitinimonas sp. TaxID=1934313 RepID=UPI002F9380C1
MSAPDHSLQLFGIQCRHGYFAHGICMPLALHPTHGCQQLLSRHQLVFRSEPGGGSVYALAGRHGDWTALAAEPDPLTFVLQCHDPALDNYTHLPLPTDGETSEQLFYFDNLSAPPGSTQTIPLLAADGCLSQHRLPYPAADAGANTSWLPPDHVVHPIERSEIARAVAAQRDARLRPWLPKEGSRGLWGVISLHPAQLRLPSNSAPFQAPCYRLDLNARQTRWRYYIVQPPRQHKPLPLEIVAQWQDQDGEPLVFQRQPGQALLGGRTAQIFVAPQPLPLQQAPGDNIRVELRTSTGRPQALPHPQAHRLNRGMDGMVYSEVFVQL